MSELLHHLEECELFPVACPLGCRDEKGEVSRVERRGVETHRACCPMRSVKCEYCSVSVKACGMNGHLEVCEEFPIPCLNKCSEEFRMKRKDKSIHLSQECPLQETECPYSQYGCEVTVQRRNLEQHEKEDMHKHLKLTINNMQREVITLQKENEEYQSKVVKLEEKNGDFRSSLQEGKEAANTLKLTIENMQNKISEQEKENAKLRTRIVQLEKNNEEVKKSYLELKSPLTKISTFVLKGNLQWKISRIKEKLSQKVNIYSEPFYVGLYKFQGNVLWNSNNDIVGLYLRIMKGEWDNTLNWPIRYKCSMVHINQHDAEDSFEWKVDITEGYLEKHPECFNKPSTERNIGFGHSQFIPHADILQDNYSKDDSITIKISVELI